MEPKRRDKLNIEELIHKLKLNKLSSDELKELLELVRSKNSEQELDAFSVNVWHNASNINEDLPSDDLLNRLHDRLKLGTVNAQRTNVEVQHSKSAKMIILRIMRYAAVFVLAFVLSSIVQNAFRTRKVLQVNTTTYNEVSVSYGSKSKIVLPDGSVVNLNSGSKIRYPSRFDNDRIVYIEGEVFFDVKKDPKHPFYVHTSDVTIKVLGTVFNVKSYPEEKIIETTLVSGSVQIFDNKGVSQSKKTGGRQIAVLKPNQKAIFVKDNREMTTISAEVNEEKLNTIEPVSPQLVIQNQVKTEVCTAWKDNRLVFDNEKFEHLVPKLERWYNIEIINDYPELNDTRVTGKFDLETIEQALLALKITTPFNYKMDKNRITIYK